MLSKGATVVDTEFDLEVINDPEFDTRTPEINYRRAHDQEFRRRYDQWRESERDVCRLMTGPYPTRDLVAFERRQERERELVDYFESNAVRLPPEIQLIRELEAALAKQLRSAKTTRDLTGQRT